MSCTYLLACFTKVTWKSQAGCLFNKNKIIFLQRRERTATCFGLSKPSAEATPHAIKYLLLSSGRPVAQEKPEKISERKREGREKNLWEKLVEKFKKQIQRRELIMDEPFSPSCDFNQCVLVWLRAEGLVSKSLESPKFFSLWFYR